MANAIDRKDSRKVILVIGGLESGGAERVLADMANYWSERDWRITLATWSGPDVADFYALRPGVTRVWLDVDSPNTSALAKLRSNVARVFKLRRLLKSERPDAVLSFIDVSNVLTILAAWGLGLRVTVSERTNPAVNHRIPRLWRGLRRLVYMQADVVVAQTADAARWIEQHCRAAVVVIPNALRSLPDLAFPREPMILGIGRLSKEKGFDVLLRAFASVRAEFPAWRVVVIGDGAERSNLLQLRHELQLDVLVDLVGPIRDVERWIARASLLVHASKREGFPNVVMEAMAMGTAVICADCRSGPADLIEDGVNGRLVPVDDVASLARVMTELMQSPELARRLGQEGVNVRQRYEQNAIMKEWERQLLPQHDATRALVQ